MKCGIVKWLISSARNRGRNLPGPVSRHLVRCSSCREFARFSRVLSETAGREARAFLEKIPAPETGGLLEKSPARTRPGPSSRRDARRLWIPASVAAAGLVLTALLIFRPAAPPRENASPDEVAEFKKLAFSGGAILNLVTEPKSPLDQEYESLKKAADSAVRVILASLDFKIGSEIRGGRTGRGPA
jgi:hypothetical protein